ncbi:MAG: hypothetical protein IJ938_02795 [Clostridia bacterium]|nr:hypothetical protein [Clostridia bacterium]
MIGQKQDYENPKISIFELEEELVRTSYTEDIYDDKDFEDENVKFN